METENSSVYVQALIQWAVFFGLMTVILLPAFLFKRAATEHGQKGWPYFFVGLLAGFISLNIGNFIMLGVRKKFPVEEYSLYLIWVLISIGLLFGWFSLTVLRKYLSRK